MDSLVDGLLNFEVTPYKNNPNAEHPYFSLYKKKSRTNQEERRQRILEARKESRYDLLMHLRNIEEKGKEGCSDNDMCEDEHKIVYKKPREYENFVMLSEWLIEVPEDFAQNYIALLCPTGQRCLSVSYKGITSVYAKNGRLITRFSSLLPGGSKKTNRRGFSVLDCIWSEMNKTYYIIDLIFWSKQSLTECETSFRFEWLKSRIQEYDSDLASVSEFNKYRFIPSPYYNCDENSLQNMFNDPFLDEVPLDGILFYNKFTHYTHGPTPLVCWLKPYMLLEVLGVQVPDKFMKDKPLSYTDIHSHVSEYNLKIKSKNISSNTVECASMEDATN